MLYTGKIISCMQQLNKITAVQECDATKDDKRILCLVKKIIYTLKEIPAVIVMASSLASQAL